MLDGDKAAVQRIVEAQPWVQEIIAFKGGKQVAKFNCLQVEGEIDECSLNGRNLSKTEGQAWLDRVPEGKEITAFFKDVVEKKE